jgi:hypothetical protein
MDEESLPLSVSHQKELYARFHPVYGRVHALLRRVHSPFDHNPHRGILRLSTLGLSGTIAVTPSVDLAEGVFKFSKQSDKVLTFISPSGFRHKPNFPNTTSQH